MRTLKVTDQLAPKYHGAGYALAAITGGQLIEIRYVMDVAPSAIAEQLHGPHAAFFVRQWLGTADAEPVVRELQALGEVSVGMLSGWEFTEL